MINFTFIDDIKPFILGASDEKPVDMSNPINNDDCGCLLIEYGRERGFHFSRCSDNGFLNFCSFDEHVKGDKLTKEFVDFCFEGGDTIPKTFADLKTLVNSEQWKEIESGI